MNLYDLRFKYRIVAGEDIEYTDLLQYAKLVAGEWQAQRDRTVEIVRQRGRIKRWKATLEPSGSVRLDELFSDGLPEDRLGYQSGRSKAMAALIDREIKRHRRKRSSTQRAEERERKERSTKFGRGVMRAVICLSTDPPKRFNSGTDAAAWLGVKTQSFFRSLRPRKNGERRKCCGMTFAYEDKLTQGERDGLRDIKEARPANGSGGTNGDPQHREAAAPRAREQREAGRELPNQQGAQQAVSVQQRQEV
jgi:hypothetical protein